MGLLITLGLVAAAAFIAVTRGGSKARARRDEAARAAERAVAERMNRVKPDPSSSESEKRE